MNVQLKIPKHIDVEIDQPLLVFSKTARVSFPDRLTPKSRLLRFKERLCGSQSSVRPRLLASCKRPRPAWAVNDLLRTHGISRATFFKWRSKYGGASVSDVTRLRELDAENAKLKRMYADLALENAAIKDVLARKL